MRSTMHHLVSAEGWILEEENDKVNRGEKEDSVLAWELGVISYRKGSGAEFPPAARYLQKTGLFWKAVQFAWNQVLEKNREVGYKGKQDARELAESLFDAADKFDPANETEKRRGNEVFGLIGEHCASQGHSLTTGNPTGVVDLGTAVPPKDRNSGDARTVHVGSVSHHTPCSVMDRPR